VTTGLDSPERVEITEGLVGGERVVSRGHEGLYAGARVSEVAEGAGERREVTETKKGMEGMPGMEQSSGKPKEGGHGGH